MHHCHTFIICDDLYHRAQLREEQARALRLAAEKSQMEGYARDLESEERKRLRDKALRDIEASRHKHDAKDGKFRALVLKVIIGKSNTCVYILHQC